jgi:hypothetical protein
VDASTDRVGIGTNVPSAKFTVIGSAAFNESGLDADFRVEGDTDASLFFVDASTDRVGIGTVTPDAKLSVNGVASFGAGAAATPSIAASGDLNTGMFFPAADTIAFSEGGAEAMRINSSGQVGIGSTNPNRTLVLDATSGSNFELKRSPNSGGLYFETDGTDGVMRSVGATGSLIFQTNGTNERMRINSSGAMLLGTTTAGSASAGDLVVNGGVFLGGTAAANELDDYEEGTHTPTVTPGTSGTLGFGSGSTVMSYIKIGNRVFVNGYLLFSTVSSAVGSSFSVTLPFAVKTGLSSDSEWGGGAILFYDISATTYYNKPFLFTAGNSFLQFIWI